MSTEGTWLFVTDEYHTILLSFKTFSDQPQWTIALQNFTHGLHYSRINWAKVKWQPHHASDIYLGRLRTKLLLRPVGTVVRVNVTELFANSSAVPFVIIILNKSRSDYA